MTCDEAGAVGWSLGVLAFPVQRTITWLWKCRAWVRTGALCDFLGMIPRWSEGDQAMNCEGS